MRKFNLYLGRKKLYFIKDELKLSWLWKRAWYPGNSIHRMTFHHSLPWKEEEKILNASRVANTSTSFESLTPTGIRTIANTFPLKSHRISPLPSHPPRHAHKNIFELLPNCSPSAIERLTRIMSATKEETPLKLLLFLPFHMDQIMAKGTILELEPMSMEWPESPCLC